MSTEEFHRLEFYQRIFAPRGLEHQVALGLTVKRPLFIALALNRCTRDFSDDELSVLDALRPHLAQAHRNVRALSALRGIDGALAESGRAMAVLDTTGDAIMSAWATEALARHFGPVTRAGLPAGVADWVEQERQAVFDDGAARIHRPLEHVADGRQLVLRFIPAASDRPAVLAIEERSPDRQSHELARLGLTRREREVMRLLGQGASSATIADRLGVRRATVDKHLEHVYRKLGVTSRTAAVAAAADAVLAKG